MNPVDRMSTIVGPINQALGSESSVIFNVPGYKYDSNGKKEWLNAKYDIYLEDESDLDKVKQVLSDQGLLEKSTIAIRTDLT